MSRPILYSFRRCPYAMRARLALDAAQIEVEHREVLLRDKPAAMLEASPKGTVPVLVLPDDRVIDESLEIMLWALGQNDADNWLRDRKSQVSAINDFLDHFKEHLDRYKYASRYSDEVDRGSVDHDQRGMAMEALLVFTTQLETAPFRGGAAPDLTDMATFPFVRQFAAVEPDWWKETASEPLQHWLGTLIASDRFNRIMVKHPLWTPAKR